MVDYRPMVDNIDPLAALHLRETDSYVRRELDPAGASKAREDLLGAAVKFQVSSRDLLSAGSLGGFVRRGESGKGCEHSEAGRHLPSHIHPLCHHSGLHNFSSVIISLHFSQTGSNIHYSAMGHY